MNNNIDLINNPEEFKKWIEEFHAIDEVQELVKFINKKLYPKRTISNQATAIENLASIHSKKIKYAKEFELEVEPSLKLANYLQRTSQGSKIELRNLLGSQPGYDAEVKINGNIKKIQITSFFNESTKGILVHSKLFGPAPTLQEYKQDGSIKEKVDSAVSKNKLIEEFAKEFQIKLEKKLDPKHTYNQSTWLLIYLPCPHRLCPTILFSFEENIRHTGFVSLEAPAEWITIKTDLYPKKIIKTLWASVNKLNLDRLFFVSDIINPQNDTFIYFDSDNP